MRRRLILAAACLALPVFVHADDKSAADAGWVSLFDGKTLDGWESYDRKGPVEVSKNWKVEDGMIHGSGDVAHLFSPRGDYKNFKYKADFKIADKANSGQYFRTKKMPGYPDGYEAQINSTHTDPVKTGSIYNRVLIKKMLVPADTWFTQEVEAVGNHITMKVNGETLYEYVDTTGNSFSEGYFAFQQHDPKSEVWIKNVMVMELPAKK